MSQYFYWLDIAVALAIPIFLFLAHQRGKISRFIWIMFWVGFALGLTWELTFHFLGPEYSEFPLYLNLTAWPLPPITQPLLHASWDSGIFLIGVWLIRRVCPAPQFERFRWHELAVLLLWGIGSALIVEMSASGSGWEYLPKWYNPPLFQFNETAIYLLPILTWAVAPTIYYTVAVWVTKKEK